MKTTDELENIFFFCEKLISDEKFDHIRNFIDQSGFAECQPHIAKKIIEISNDENASINDIEKIVSSDPVIAAKILKMANSSFYKLSREVSSIKRAILILGITMIKDIALSIAILDMFKTKNKGIMSAIWEHSVATSVGARLLSINFAEDIDSDVCFTAGLLHDIGKMLMAKKKEYITVTRTMSEEGHKQALEVEKDLFGFSHTELGAVLATMWDFSPEMHYIIFNHHIIGDIIKVDQQSLAVPSQYVWNTAIISAADISAHILGAGSEKFSIDAMPLDLVTFLGYDSINHFKEGYLTEFKSAYEHEKMIFN